MGGKTRSETAAAFLRRVTKEKSDRKAKEAVEQALDLLKQTQIALRSMGLLTLVVMPTGMFQWSMSPHLMTNRQTLDAVDQALSDMQGTVRELRRQVIERDLAKAHEHDSEESSDGENSTDS